MCNIVEWLIELRGHSVVFCLRWQGIHDSYTTCEVWMTVIQEAAVEIIARKCQVCTGMYSKIYLSSFYVHWYRKIIYLFRDIVSNDVIPHSLIEVTSLFGVYTASIRRVEVSLKMEAACFSRMLLNFYQNEWHYISEDSKFCSHLYENLKYRVFILLWMKIIDLTLNFPLFGSKCNIDYLLLLK
jgi:hypothetical protein